MIYDTKIKRKKDIKHIGKNDKKLSNNKHNNKRNDEKRASKRL